MDVDRDVWLLAVKTSPKILKEFAPKIAISDDAEVRKARGREFYERSTREFYAPPQLDEGSRSWTRRSWRWVSRRSWRWEGIRWVPQSDEEIVSDHLQHPAILQSRRPDGDRFGRLPCSQVALNHPSQVVILCAPPLQMVIPPRWSHLPGGHTWEVEVATPPDVGGSPLVRCTDVGRAWGR